MIRMTGLEYLIRERNISYVKLAKELHVPLEVLMSWVKAEKPIKRTALEQLSQKFNVEEKFIINIFEIEFKKRPKEPKDLEEHKKDVIMQNLDSIFGALKMDK